MFVSVFKKAFKPYMQHHD